MEDLKCHARAVLVQGWRIGHGIVGDVQLELFGRMVRADLARLNRKTSSPKLDARKEAAQKKMAQTADLLVPVTAEPIKRGPGRPRSEAA